MRSYGEPIEVRRRDAEPEQFVWRGRLYVVRDVLAHWREAGGWWRRPDAGVDDGDRECWRVEAGSARATGVYDLCFDAVRGDWAVLRVHD